MPRTLKQYYRKILVQLGRFDEGAFKLAIDAIYPDDTFLVSYPKSGNTWLRFLIANMLHSQQAIHFRNIDQFVPDIYSATKQVNRLQRPRYIKTHDAWFELYPKCIYIVRDYRDVVVSYYHYQKALGAYQGEITDFLNKMDTLHPFGHWEQHVQKALQQQEHHPEKILLLRYEDLSTNANTVIDQIRTFTGIQTVQSNAELIERCSFSQLRELEQKHGSAFKDKSQHHFFREGKIGNWKTELPPDFAHMITDFYQEPLTQLGYMND